MSLLSLSDKILPKIVEHMTDVRDINSLVQTNSRLYKILNPYLYKYDSKHRNSFAIRWGAHKGNVGTVKNSISEVVDFHGEDIQNKTTQNVECAVLAAARLHHKEVLRLLLEWGAFPSPYDIFKRNTPILAHPSRFITDPQEGKNHPHAPKETSALKVLVEVLQEIDTYCPSIRVPNEGKSLREIMRPIAKQGRRSGRIGKSQRPGSRLTVRQRFTRPDLEGSRFDEDTLDAIWAMNVPYCSCGRH